MLRNGEKKYHGSHLNGTWRQVREARQGGKGERKGYLNSEGILQCRRASNLAGPSSQRPHILIRLRNLYEHKREPKKKSSFKSQTERSQSCCCLSVVTAGMTELQFDNNGRGGGEGEGEEDPMQLYKVRESRWEE